MICLPLGIGGTETHLRSVLPALKRQGFDIMLVTLGEPGPVGRFIEQAGVPVISRRRPGIIEALAETVPAIDSLDLFFWLFWQLIRHRPAVAHFYLPKPYLIGGVAAIAAFVPTRVMSRRSLRNYQSMHRLIPFAEQILHRKMRAVLGNSRAVVQQLREEGVPARRIGLIYNGFPIPAHSDRRTKMRLRSRLEIAEDELVVVKVASFYPYKRHDLAITAAMTLTAQFGKSWRMVLAGRDAGEKGSAIKLADRLGQMERILFIDEVNDLGELLRACDVGLLCSDQEGFSNAILEYMANGLPVVATRVGGNEEAVAHGTTGLLVPPGDPQAIAEAISLMFVDGTLRSRMGLAARRRVKEEFSDTTMLDDYSRLYRTLLSDPDPDFAEILPADPVRQEI